MAAAGQRAQPGQFVGGFDGGVGLLVVDRGVEVAEGSGAEAEWGDLDAAAAQGGHRPAAGRGLRPCMPPSTASAVPVVAPDIGLAK